MQRLEDTTMKPRKDKSEIYNLVKFIRAIQTPSTIKLLQTLADEPKSYTDILCLFGFKTKTSAFAYYLRKAVKAGLVKKDTKTKLYYLTFKGIKSAELLQSLDKIANLGIGNLEDVKTQLIVDLHTNKNWLKPLIKSEIRQAIRELADKSEVRDS